jgi:ribonucleoside-diphosphate reductase alpha chain
MKYRLRDAAGHALDANIEATFARIATAAAQAEAPHARTHWAEVFAAAMAGHRFLPAGRILAGAGANRRVTLFNCFVMGRIPDSMEGIFQSLKEAALTLQQGGGIGYDFSTLRPKGAPVERIGADASGPLSFMDVWDAMCRTIMSAGSRRGAMMGCMRADHPDIEAFIEAKRDPQRLRMFNLSVLVPDAFMAAVAGDKAWDLTFEGRVFKTLPARGLYDRIMRSTYETAEPGVIFIDRINQENALNYCETICATNPCVTGETWVHTDRGPRQVHDLVGRRFGAIVDGKIWASDDKGFFATGRKPVFRLVCQDGHSLRLTGNHCVRVTLSQTRGRRETEWRAVCDLKPGDEIVLHDHRELAFWGGAERSTADSDEGYLLGLLVGDGTIKSDKVVLSAWPGAQCVNGGWERPGIAGVMARALEAARTLHHRSDFTGWVEVAGRGEYRLSLAAFRGLSERFGLAPGCKTITPQIEMASSAFYRGFLQGLFDADGSVQGTQAKGISVRLAQSDLGLLRAAQRMLLRLGISATIYAERRPQGTTTLPDSRRQPALYAVRAQHELVISGENLALYAERVGFADGDKSARLRALLSQYRRRLNRANFAAKLVSAEPNGEEEVFDVRIPGINAFDANGFVAHNCGEQPLPPYGACLLGSINLAALITHPFTEDAALDEAELEALTATAVRFLDDVIDVSLYPLPEQAHEAKAKRRIGLGVTGLADAFILSRVRYGSTQSLALTDRWLTIIEESAYQASAALAAEKGAFPLFDAKRYLTHKRIAALPVALREAIAAHGLRNGLLTSIAPTGTISLFAGNVSSGIEPVFAYRTRRRLLMQDGREAFAEIEDYAHRLYRETFGADRPLPDYFIASHALTPSEHVRIQATAQRHVDSAISKTINCPEAINFEAFRGIYEEAYASGCKGCTTYRPNPVTGAVLAEQAAPSPAARTAPMLARPAGLPAVAEAVAGKPAEASAKADIVYMTQPLERPETLPGETYKVRWPDSDHAIYITLNDIVLDKRRRPFEIFINSKNMEHYAWTVALTRMISAVFRRGGDVSFVVDELKAVFDPRGGQWMKGRYVPSLLAAIGDVIETHMRAIGFLAPAQDAPSTDERAERARLAIGNDRPQGRPCPRCGRSALVASEGCLTCHSCGYSKCA